MNLRRVLLGLSLVLMCARSNAADRVILGSRDAEVSPLVVSLDGSCMGVLLHPHAVVYPAHCGTQHEAIQTRDGVRPTVRCEALPEWNTKGRDIAYCLLGSGTPEHERALSVLPPCAHELQEGDQLELLAQSDEFAEAASVTVRAVGIDLMASDPEIGICPGASGGPAFYQVDVGGDALPRLVGLISSGAFGCEPGQDVYLSAIHPYLGWLEQRTGLDLTPCMNDQGNWEISGRCEDDVPPTAELGECGTPLLRNEKKVIAIERAEVLLEGSLDALAARFSIAASPEEEISEVEVTLSCDEEPPRVKRRRWGLQGEIEFRGLASESYVLDIVVRGISGDRVETRRTLDLSAAAAGCQVDPRAGAQGGALWMPFALLLGAFSARSWRVVRKNGRSNAGGS